MIDVFNITDNDLYLWLRVSPIRCTGHSVLTTDRLNPKLEHDGSGSSVLELKSDTTDSLSL